MLKNKTAVVTGSNRGIGRAIVKLFAQNGAEVIACARRPDPAFTSFLEGLSKETGCKLTPVYFDLGDAAQVKEGLKEIGSKCPVIDILVNNAAMIFTAPFSMTSVEKIKEQFEVNYFSQVTIMQTLVRKMIPKKEGSVINISSSAGIEGNAGRLAYAASKAALINSTLVLAEELGGFNIRVNAIAPGLTDTEMMTSSTKDDALQTTLDRTCLKRVGKPEEIAGAALFLASSLSTFMTGQVLRIDGGM
ncbi:MAG: SDR family oxidoreductase [Deltaproteobacteria bacterium]|nr:SDR family oxidoreductase [Deltaproteobacteria bacterium]MBI3295796.1 SDR family oxidoreductase [Deltaproteobacteria bacterium]